MCIRDRFHGQQLRSAADATQRVLDLVRQVAHQFLVGLRQAVRAFLSIQPSLLFDLDDLHLSLIHIYKFVYKMRWQDALHDWVRTELAAHPRLVLMGDFNVAPDDRDVYDPVGWHNQIHCTPQERAQFQRCLLYTSRCV